MPGGGGVIGVGAFSAAYGLRPLVYAATAGFDFTPSNPEALDLKLISDKDVGVGLDSLEVKVSVVSAGVTTHYYDKTFLLGGAETFFTNNHLIQLGTVAAGSLSSVSITYDLTYHSGTLAKVGNGFDFTYDLASSAVAATPIATAFDFPVSQWSTVPEPSTWAMMLIGFAGLGYAAYRRHAATPVADCWRCS
jgi:hypothetical protein